MRTAAADLHIHSLLSPCASHEMTPPKVLKRAVEQGLSFIAITDHNSVLNVPAFCQAAKDFPIKVVPGMELQTREDVHLICLFDAEEKAFRLQEIVDQTLPKIKNREEFFGQQLIVDEKGTTVGVEDRLLLNALNLSLNEAVAEVVRIGGVCIAAHVDRQSYSLLVVLGLIPAKLPLVALEVSDREAVADLYQGYKELEYYPLIFSSDAHYLADVGKISTQIPQSINNLASLLDFLRRVAKNKKNRLLTQDQHQRRFKR